MRWDVIDSSCLSPKPPLLLIDVIFGLASGLSGAFSLPPNSLSASAESTFLYPPLKDYRELSSVAVESRLNSLAFIEDSNEHIEIVNNLHIYSGKDNTMDYLKVNIQDNCLYADLINNEYTAIINNPNKIVIGPKKWFGPRGPQDQQDIIPENWITI